LENARRAANVGAAWRKRDGTGVAVAGVRRRVAAVLGVWTLGRARALAPGVIELCWAGLGLTWARVIKQSIYYNFFCFAISIYYYKFKIELLGTACRGPNKCASDHHLIRACLELYEMQNSKYQLLWNDEMQNTKIFRVTFSFVQNTEFIALIMAS